MNNKLKNIQEANKRLEVRMLFETTEGVSYSIQQNPQTKRFRIFATTPKFKTPTDAETVFGKGTYWRDYSTQDEAQRTINSFGKVTQQSTTGNTESQFGSGTSSQSGETDSDFGSIMKEDVQKIKSFMKKIILFLMGIFMGFAIAAQPPTRQQGQRPLPNQFRDFLDHQQGLEIERPQIEKKDGKVVITMTELQFNRMQQMRAAQRFRMAQHKPQPVCSKCQRHHGKLHRRKI